MAPYIGTATSRVDGFAKVTGSAKYAAEYNVPGLAHASVVCATIARGRIIRIDTSAALRAEGVITVLTHENRPPMADSDQAYKDNVAPEGSPFRPLYDGRIMFDGQPIALVVAETSETARFAASLVRAEYEKEPHVTDVYRQRDKASAVKDPATPFDALFTPPRRRGAPEQALTAAVARHDGEYYVPIEHHNPMELYASTVIVENDGAHNLRQDPGRPECPALPLRCVRHEASGRARRLTVCGWRVRLRVASAVSGGAGGTRSARAAALSSCRADTAANVCAGLPAGDDSTHRAGR
jgi:CO/xanthine dehydrogenase Mo-binding subunit